MALPLLWRFDDWPLITKYEVQITWKKVYETDEVSRLFYDFRQFNVLMTFLILKVLGAPSSIL